jgi:hypothetical protein
MGEPNDEPNGRDITSELLVAGTNDEVKAAIGKTAPEIINPRAIATIVPKVRISVLILVTSSKKEINFYYLCNTK